jgi:indole-3-glycerol phosphate synthase
MNILNEIIAHKKIEVARKKKEIRIATLEQSESFSQDIRSLRKSISAKDFGIIAEFKRKSPSKGVIIKEDSPLETARNYQSAQVAGMSILTDNKYFGGNNEDLTAVRKELDLPLLRKDFIIDEYQIFEAKSIGADCILLIAEALEKTQLLEFSIIAKSLGLEVLMELHSLDQLEKINSEIDILGVNNRDLKKQKVNIQNSLDLFSFLPKDVLKISESGIYTNEQIKILADKGFKGALIGTSILESGDAIEKIKALTNELNTVKV